MEKLVHFLDSLHSSVINRWWTQLFTAFTRVLLAIGFIPPSIPKILHKPFTVLPDSHPVGAYFNALYNTGFYYDFIGWSQLLAALLLLIPRTSHLGALMFLPIILNITVLTNSVGFDGTWLITILMSLAAIYLVAWEYDRLKPILFYSRTLTRKLSAKAYVGIPLFFGVGGICSAVLLWAASLGHIEYTASRSLVLGLIGVVFGLIVTVHYRFMKNGPLKPPRKAIE